MRKYTMATSLGFLVLLGSMALPALSSQAPEDEKAIRAVVENYLKAKDWKERLPFVHDAAKQKAAMGEKYQDKEFQLVKPAVQKIEEFAKPPGTYLVKATWMEKSQGPTVAGYYIVRKTAAGIKIDWPASVGYNPVNLKSLVAKKPNEAQTLRLIAKIDSAYQGDYAGARNSHYCFLLKEDNPLQIVLGYVPKTSADGKRLYELLKKRQEGRDRVIVEIRFVGPAGQEAENPRTVSITKLVSESWLAP